MIQRLDPRPNLLDQQRVLRCIPRDLPIGPQERAQPSNLRRRRQVRAMPKIQKKFVRRNVPPNQGVRRADQKRLDNDRRLRRIGICPAYRRHRVGKAFELLHLRRRRHQQPPRRRKRPPVRAHPHVGKQLLPRDVRQDKLRQRRKVFERVRDRRPRREVGQKIHRVHRRQTQRRHLGPSVRRHTFGRGGSVWNEQRNRGLPRHRCQQRIGREIPEQGAKVPVGQRPPRGRWAVKGKEVQCVVEPNCVKGHACS